MLERTNLSQFFQRNEDRIFYIFYLLRRLITKKESCVVCTKALKQSEVNKCGNSFCEAIYCLPCYEEQKNTECVRCHLGKEYLFFRLILELAKT